MYQSSLVKQLQQPMVVTGTITSLEKRKSELFSYVTTVEHERAIKLKRKQQREVFLLIRGYLRFLLSNVLHREPQSICIAYGSYGKPYLDEEDSYHFNVSHSMDRYLIGIRASGLIGVDVECSRSLPSIHPMFFHPEEIAYLSRGTKHKRVERWLWVWTRKEAFGKAIGEGLSERTVSFSVLGDLVEFKGKNYALTTDQHPNFTQSICVEIE
ncbi:4'-phosphopantetheinyl transferase family protein [Halalkalibacter alkalisediminis]|uniref:4'-phosphopantetheinyl transferase family protein n=1 Tax=Halalkalibacter alkalisediminis TaxID=935616 RepID=A0ABV6NR21_9BACI|nr:4'-phosphopantetheinyl transferase superfamily protein [Halalkalibacter alkalisediminis]